MHDSHRLCTVVTGTQTIHCILHS